MVDEGHGGVVESNQTFGELELSDSATIHEVVGQKMDSCSQKLEFSVSIIYREFDTEAHFQLVELPRKHLQ